MNTPTHRVYSLAAMWVGCFLSSSASSWQVEIPGSSTNTFSFGEEVVLKICDAEGNRTAQIDIQVSDHNDATVASLKARSSFHSGISGYAGSEGCVNFDMPVHKLGFYRVYVKIDGVSIISAQGSRPPGYITYAIVPDPELRKTYADSKSFFGLQGGFNPHNQLLLSQLGVRWVLGGYSWRALGPGWQRTPNKLATGGVPSYAWARRPSGGLWQTYSLPTLFMIDPVSHKHLLKRDTIKKHSSALNKSGQTEWRSYCRAVAASYMRQNPDRQQRIYQITWEPVAPWGFAGSVVDLVDIYKIAYTAIHDIDDAAFVIGPAGAPLNDKSLDWTRSLLEAGLANYIDGFSVHPYTGFPPVFPPETQGFVEYVRALRSLLDTYKNSLPIFGTEQGYEANARSEDELLQAQGLIRTNLILLGERWRLNIAFYSHDFYVQRAGSTKREGGYGLYYGLDSDRSWGDREISPKPVVPAYAAMTYLLEGHRSLGPIKGLDGTAMGYSYQLDDEIVLALWDYGDKPRRAVIPVDAQELEIYDMMGNVRKASAPQKNIELLLDKDPVYIRYIRR